MSSFCCCSFRHRLRAPNGSHAELRGQARAPKPCGRQVAAYTAGQRHAICNLHDAAALEFGSGGSAAGTKPGRDSSSVKLGGRYLGARFCTVARPAFGVAFGLQRSAMNGGMVSCLARHAAHRSVSVK